MCRSDYWIDEPCSICDCRVQCGDPWMEYPEAVFVGYGKDRIVFCQKCFKKYSKNNKKRI